MTQLNAKCVENGSIFPVATLLSISLEFCVRKSTLSGSVINAVTMNALNVRKSLNGMQDFHALFVIEITILVAKA